MLYRLCKEWGGDFIHPDHLAPHLSERQLTGWQDFFTLEPWGTHADDYRAAMISWAAIGPPSKRRSINDFIPQWAGKDPLTPEEYKARAVAAHKQAAATS